MLGEGCDFESQGQGAGHRMVQCGGVRGGGEGEDAGTEGGVAGGAVVVVGGGVRGKGRRGRGREGCCRAGAAVQRHAHGPGCRNKLGESEYQFASLISLK